MLSITIPEYQLQVVRRFWQAAAAVVDRFCQLLFVAAVDRFYQLPFAADRFELTAAVVAGVDRFFAVVDRCWRIVVVVVVAAAVVVVV